MPRGGGEVKIKTKIKCLLFFLVVLFIFCMMILIEDSRGQEGCGRWMKLEPVNEWIDSCFWNEKTGWRITRYCVAWFLWFGGNDIPDSVFVPTECPPDSIVDEIRIDLKELDKTQLNNLLRVIGEVWGDELVDGFLDTAIAVWWRLHPDTAVVKPDTACWHWEESCVCSWPLLEFNGDTVIVNGCIKRKVYEPCE